MLHGHADPKLFDSGHVLSPQDTWNYIDEKNPLFDMMKS